MTSYYNQHQDHQPAITVKLPEPTVDPVVLTRAAKRLLPQILVGAKYARAGVVVMDLQPWAMQETFDPYISAHEAKQIGPLIQQIRSEHGVKSIGLGVAGLQQGPAWEMRSEMMSPGTRRFGKNCSPSNPSKRGVGICHGPGCLVLLPFQELRLRFELAS
ncbi:hypothetical protein GCM10007173_10430 [Glutamicibacter ardleyensis]|uniref:DNA polymerase Y-family little finger domain-containing protein n=3 Tax=Micrococcaceae TaxID=1268 RepID=A0ABQ2DCY0_9MICC|nr:hypothetical protein GCM10007173_10430 [Glutamicibacter ardleyensis]